MEKVAKKRINTHFKNYPGYFDTKEYESFLEIIAMLKNKNKRILLVKFPVTNAYKIEAEKLKDFSFTLFYEQYFGYLSSNEQITILDYRDIYKEHQEYFYDSDHLNEQGSIELSHLLKKNI